MDKLYDISLELHHELPVWPGSQAFKLSPLQRLADGDSCNESMLSANIHTGTHVDAPWHFIENGNRCESLELDILVGPAVVISLPGVERITAQDLESAGIPERSNRLLIKTRNSNLWARGEAEFQEDFVALTADAAKWLVEQEFRLVGIDYLSIQLFGDSNLTHQILLEEEIVIVEGLNLHDIDPGHYELICLPLSISGAEGSLARAILRKFVED